MAAIPFQNKLRQTEEMPAGGTSKEKLKMVNVRARNETANKPVAYTIRRISWVFKRIKRTKNIFPSAPAQTLMKARIFGGLAAGGFTHTKKP